MFTVNLSMCTAGGPLLWTLRTARILGRAGPLYIQGGKSHLLRLWQREKAALSSPDFKVEMFTAIAPAMAKRILQLCP